MKYRAKCKNVQSAISMFWHQWIKECLPTLADQKKWKTKCRNFELGDLVIIPVKQAVTVTLSHYPCHTDFRIE